MGWGEFWTSFCMMESCLEDICNIFLQMHVTHIQSPPPPHSTIPVPDRRPPPRENSVDKFCFFA